MRTQKLMWHNIMRSTKSQKVSVLHYSIDVWMRTINASTKKNDISRSSAK